MNTKIVSQFRDFFTHQLKNIWGTLTPDDRKDNKVYCRDIYGNLYRVVDFEDNKHEVTIKIERI